MDTVIDYETGEIIEDVAFEINREHELFESSMRNSVEHAIRCGELLAEQKAKLNHGEWIPWVENNLDFSDRHARRYIKIASNRTRVSDLDSGASLRSVLKLLAKNEREVSIEEQRKEIEEGIASLPPGTFEVIVIDPPWPYGTKYDPDGRRSANPYPEQSLEEISNMNIPFSDDCVLWLWTTHKFMRYSFDLLDSWGFRDVAIVTWVKDRMGLGAWLRSQSEFCIMAVKGSPKILLTNQTTVIHGSMREHSRKPDEFYGMVESLCVGRKLDYYSREERNGWEQYGNELARFTES